MPRWWPRQPPAATLEFGAPYPRISVQVLVGREREELGEVVAEGDALEHGARLVGPALLPHLVADLGADLGHLLVEHRAHVVACELAVADPLPDLRARDLRRGGVLHQVVDAGR